MSAIQGPKFVLFGDGGEEESVTIDKYDPEITMPEWKVDLDSHSSALHKVIKVTESLQERRDIAADMTDLHRTTETDQVWFIDKVLGWEQHPENDTTGIGKHLSRSWGVLLDELRTIRVTFGLDEDVKQISAEAQQILSTMGNDDHDDEAVPARSGTPTVAKASTEPQRALTSLLGITMPYLEFLERFEEYTKFVYAEFWKSARVKEEMARTALTLRDEVGASAGVEETAGSTDESSGQ